MAEYIEREAVERMLEGAQLISDADGEYCGYCTEDISIHSIPAADVAPVVHGRWESHLMPLAYKCSICGYKPSAKEWRFHERNFCPNCGAKMDQE